MYMHTHARKTSIASITNAMRPASQTATAGHLSYTYTNIHTHLRRARKHDDGKTARAGQDRPTERRWHRRPRHKPTPHVYVYNIDESIKVRAFVCATMRTRVCDCSWWWGLACAFPRACLRLSIMRELPIHGDVQTYHHMYMHLCSVCVRCTRRSSAEHRCLES